MSAKRTKGRGIQVGNIHAATCQPSSLCNNNRPW